MARIAMLSDIHSNWVALQAVLREVAVSGVDRVIWDEGEGVVELRKTNYDRFAAAQAIVEAGLPLESAARLLTAAEFEILKHR